MKSNIGDLPYFYAPDISSSLTLPQDEAKHAFRVLRLEVGENVLITDGLGNLYSAKISNNSLKGQNVTDLVLVETTPPMCPKLEVAIAPTKNIDRIEWSLEKLTEIGITRFSLVVTEHTIRRCVNMERLERIMVAAMKQSEKLRTVELNLFPSLKDYLSQITYEGRYIGYCADTFEKRELKETFVSGVDSSFLVGPEGDFTNEEVKLALSYGFKTVSLGSERLRTETAGIYVGILHHILN